MKIFTIMIIALVLTSQFIPIKGATAILEVSTENIYLVAGQENQITIKLKNNGDYKIFDIEAFLSSTTPGISILSEAHQVYTEIRKGKTKSYNSTIYIDQRVELGSYSLSLTILYRKFGAGQDSSITVPVGLVVSEGYIPKIRFSSDQGSIKVSSGTENQISFQFNNNYEEELVDIQFSLSSSSTYISIVDGINFHYDNFVSGGLVTIQPTISILEGTPLGAYTVTATVTYKDLDGNRYHQVFSLPLNLDTAGAVRNTIITIKGMEVSSNLIRPGDLFDLSLEIECNSADAYDLLAAVNFGTGGYISPLSPTTISLGDLNAGSSKIASYNLLAGGDISAGQYPMTTTITFIDSKGLIRSFSETLTIMIDGLIEFELLDVPTILVKVGELKEIEADLLLVGTESVQFVSVEMLEDDVFKKVSGSEEYIGAIDPDSPIPFDISFKMDEKAEPKDYKMGLKIQYRDHLNRIHEEDISLDVSVTAGSDFDVDDGTPRGGIFMWLRRLLGLGP